MNLNEHDRALPIGLRKGKHLKSNPGDARSILNFAFDDLDEAEVLSSFRRLHANGMVRRVPSEARPGALLLRLTDDGIAYADQLIQALPPTSFRQRIKAVPRSDWIAIGALLVSFMALFKGS